MYRLYPTGHVQRLADMAFIPDDPTNSDRRDYQRWLDDGNTPQPPPPPSFDEARDAKIDDLAAIRWNKETGGISVPDIGFIPTDRVTQDRIGQTLAAMDRGFITMVRWKMPDGFIAFDKPTLEAIASIVVRHVQACYDREAELRAAIDATQDRTALDAIDIAAGWPGGAE